ncbi:putative 1-deoxy-D-xylulose-5-phosphate synthase 2, chloroplastic [Trifolium repens]|nr:putative 1-deoxy-D-xylulose-5-phosphate synthase 2, chloroplastic [Trifolium repens]
MLTLATCLSSLICLFDCNLLRESTNMWYWTIKIGSRQRDLFIVIQNNNHIRIKITNIIHGFISLSGCHGAASPITVATLFYSPFKSLATTILL